MTWCSSPQAMRRSGRPEREGAAIENLRAMLPEPTDQHVYDLWHEFEEGKTAEAKFARALDLLEVQNQHNLADLSTWEPVEYGLVYSKPGRYSGHDTFLQAFTDAVIEVGERKMGRWWDRHRSCPGESGVNCRRPTQSAGVLGSSSHSATCSVRVSQFSLFRNSSDSRLFFLARRAYFCPPGSAAPTLATIL